MKQLRLVFLPIALAWLLAAATPASISGQNTAFEADPARTTVEFDLGDTLHKVHGTFALKHGSIRFDPASGRASGELVVDAASGDSGSVARDHRMIKNVLDADRFPEIIFRPERLEGKVETEGVSHVVLHGVFTIHGDDHELAMPLEVQPADGGYTAKTSFTVPYVKWGMKRPNLLLLRVSDQVEISIHTAMRKTGS